MTVARILNEKGREVATTNASASLAEVAATLATRRIGALVVTSGDMISGIISERDVVRAVAEHGSEALRMLVGDCMTANVVTCRPEDTIEHVMSAMTSHRFRHLPVLRDGRLAGIVSIGDVVKHRMQEIVSEAEHMKEYIAMA